MTRMTRTKTIARSDLDAGRIDLSDVVDASVPHLPATTPGEVLREEFMAPMGLSATRLAKEIGVPPNRITTILNGTRIVTAETAILLGRRFGTSPRFWMNLQVAHDLEVAAEKMVA